MKNFIGNTIKFLTKPLVAAKDFVADHGLNKWGVLWGLGVSLTIVVPALLGAFTLSSLAALVVAGVGAAPFLLSSAAIFLGAGAEKLYDYGDDLRHKAIAEEIYKDNETVAQIKKEMKEDNEKYAKYNGMSKKQIKKQVQFERHVKQSKNSVDEVGY